ncbi:response regulator [Haliovirga abyssi]|uniref:Diguanylate cyclase n=1 Tax=Haliovirga abyssi TaxID=2996794 RepID=A0AAU9E2C3_9FUSO|nr:response regulator [Haliovirga abyssi]BDU50550.1 hypothetical protein HLVA_11190 [Haliovirga abyssi]
MKNVLHIESSKVIRKIFSSAINSLGWNYLYSVEKTKEISEIVKERDINFLIISYETEGMELIDVLKELKKINKKDLVIIISTTKEEIAYKKDMFELGVMDVLHKDMTYEELVLYLKKIMELSSLEKQYRGIKIGMLDDSAIALNIAKSVLTLNKFYNVDYYKDENEFLDNISKYDIYLVDLILPKISGMTIISNIREKYPEKKIILISGMGNPENISNALQIGANDYVIKPFNPMLFIARLRVTIRDYMLTKELKNLALRDAMTKLYNHQYIYERVKSEVSEVNRYKNKLSVIMFDIDDFKSVNDKYGHQMGDIVIKEIVGIIKNLKRDCDIAGRYGGDEFLIILPNTDEEGAVAIAYRIRKAVENIMIITDEKITISGGVAEYKEGLNDISLVNLADERLYKAKNSGKNKIVK